MHLSSFVSLANWLTTNPSICSVEAKTTSSWEQNGNRLSFIFLHTTFCSKVDEDAREFHFPFVKLVERWPYILKPACSCEYEYFKPSFFKLCSVVTIPVIKTSFSNLWRWDDQAPLAWPRVYSLFFSVAKVWPINQDFFPRFFWSKLPSGGMLNLSTRWVAINLRGVAMRRETGSLIWEKRGAEFQVSFLLWLIWQDCFFVT